MSTRAARWTTRIVRKCVVLDMVMLLTMVRVGSRTPGRGSPRSENGDGLVVDGGIHVARRGSYSNTDHCDRAIHKSYVLLFFLL